MMNLNRTERDEIAALIRAQRKGKDLFMYPVSGVVDIYDDIKDELEAQEAENWERYRERIADLYYDGDESQVTEEDIEDLHEIETAEVGSGCFVRWDYREHHWVEA